jgi:hypothetical protein
VGPRALVVITIVFAVGFALGARLTDGPLGLLALYVAGLGMATIGTGWGLGLAFRFRDMRAAAIMQLTLFLALFLTTAQAPLEVMEGWLYDVARVNPLTNVLRLARMGFLGEVTLGTCGRGCVRHSRCWARWRCWFARTGLAPPARRVRVPDPVLTTIRSRHSTRFREDERYRRAT